VAVLRLLQEALPLFFCHPFPNHPASVTGDERSPPKSFSPGVRRARVDSGRANGHIFGRARNRVIMSAPRVIRATFCHQHPLSHSTDQ
jgi:hypothetical protein